MEKFSFCEIFREKFAAAQKSTNEPPLDNCPFCGADAYIHEHGFYGGKNTFGIRCGTCGAQTNQFYESPEMAAGAWNRRVTNELRR